MGRWFQTASGLLLATLFAAFFLLISDKSFAPSGSFIYGCDNFAYQRQAELFRKRGVSRGFDTRIDGDDATALIAIAESAGLERPEWQMVLGPHCHHFDTHSGRIIAQYPPGTPLVLSIFPRGTAGYGAYLVFIVASCLAGLLFVTLGAPSLGQVTVASLFAMESCRYFFLPASWASFSVDITAGLALLLASLLVVEPKRRASSIAYFLLVGCVAGILFAVRLPNVFVIIGVAIMLAGRFDLYRPAVLRARWPEVIAGAAAFLVSGPAIIATGNWRNTGSLFHTTYGTGDAAGSIWSYDLLLHHARFYLLESDAATLVDMSLAVVALSSVAALSPAVGHRFRWATGSAAVTTVVSLVFFMTHEITAPYYLVPSAIFSIAVPTMTAFGTRAGPRLPVMRFGAVVGAALILLAAFYRTPIKGEAGPFSFAIPPEVVAPGAIVWADYASGTLLYYNGKLGSKLIFATPCDRLKLIAAAERAGAPQYFIDDSPMMHEQIDNLSKVASLKKIGEYEIFQPMSIYKLEAAPSDLAACT